ncbi:Serine/threonine-protein kinase ppk4 [Tolypocladium ophioglossoides CBS 100239]|uniref:non-specific serine/threonine protein kinase n=1 Tax=Tolypocladium ophioglossoides (strain CBS 100239) TaxID=1163406 RepID=A0A0L0N7J0_TOLOC|nr:Serine/threonine-protein kinase ppk4 [Tolypocladium ophioglossoides CBS 100239]
MLRRPPNEGRGSSQQQKLLLAFAFFLLPWLQLADAQQQQQQQQRQPLQQVVPSVLPHAGVRSNSNQQLPDDAAVHNWAATYLDNRRDDAAAAADDDDASQTAREKKEPSPASRQYERLVDRAKQQYRRQPVDSSNTRSKKPITNNKRHVIIPDDASAIATLAPAQSVRAPHPPRHQRPTSIPATGLTSPQSARSLADWEVEDFVLLATVDGDLYASDRKTGKERWHLEVDQPMVETIHHRANNSILDDDYSPVDHYIWAVEPNRDGGVYVWIPSPDARPRATGFTMKRLVEELAPYADEEPPVVYTGDKKTTMITLDAATGRVIKWFGSGGSQINEAESCLRPNALYDNGAGECSSTGTITLGRTEYTVGIQRRDGRAIATLKYSEWSPNNYDNDLLQQYHVSLDSHYITSRHDGKVYAFDYARAGNAAPLFSQKFSAPVARVFDVCRPWDASAESNPELVVLPQPTMPSQDENIALVRSSSIFLNQTEAGSWYALSGRAYPLIVDAPLAQVTYPGWWDVASAWESLNDDTISKALVGTHSLETFRNDGRQPPTLPPGTVPEGSEGPDNNESILPRLPDGGEEEPTIINKVKGLPQSAANSVVDFIKNPILFLLFFTALIYNEKKLRRSYHRWRTNGRSLRDTLLYLTSDASADKEGNLRVDITDETQPARPMNEESEEQAKKRAQVHAQPLPAEGAQPGTVQNSDEFDDKQAQNGTSEPNQDQASQNDLAEASPPGGAQEKKKKAHRGRRGGVKHRKGRALDASQSRDDEESPTTVEEAVNNAKKLGDRPSLEPDVMTVANDMQAVTGPIIRMGNIEVNTEVQLGTGSNGTLVFAGNFDGREVAVKRMLIQFYDIASQETRLLRESDDHPNVIRYYSQQTQGGFLYIALERCAASLADVVERPHAFRELANAGRVDLPAVLYQITNGMSHLHGLRIVHRDLKPHNILVNMGKDGKPRMLVSDFGLCKKLEGGQSSFGATTGRAAGTSGWRAPELLLDDDARDTGMIDASTHSGSGSVLVGDGTMSNSRRATRAIDIFSLGLVFFYVLTNGSHPFDCGDRYMREVNIRKGSYNLRPLDSLGDFAYEAKDLIASMLEADPRKRPTARDIMSHPFFWSAKKRLSFLCDVSDHFEKEPRDPPSAALAELERHALQVTKGDFLRVLPRDFVDSLGKQRKYTGSKLLDLLRALRNKRNHYEDMPEALKRTVGPLPEGYLGFWTVRFPMLLLVCWNIVYNVQWEETDRFREYYEPAGL